MSRYWYSPLLPEETQFPAACRDTLVSFIASISSQVARKRPVDIFLDFLTNCSSIVIVFLGELSTALSAASATDSSTIDALHRYLEENPNSSLATVLDFEQQDRKLQAVSEDVLEKFLEPKAYVFNPVRLFLREVLAKLIMKATVTTCSKPEFLNTWIVYLLEDVSEPSTENVADAEIIGGAQVLMEDSTSSNTVMEMNANPGSHESPARKSETHRRTVSRAEIAMEEAMQEAKRLTELIATEEQRRKSHDHTGSNTSLSTSELTPTSSHSDLANAIPANDLAAINELQIAEITHAPEPSSAAVFTTFDQMLPSLQPSALKEASSSVPPLPPPLTLHNANISIFDDAMPGEKGTLKSKPTIEYLLQIEPTSLEHLGWMIPRKYADFETLHETIRKIANVSGVPEFSRRYETVPAWKGQTKAALRSDLEVYLRSALSHNRLAESDAMKRFLDKEQGQGKSLSGTTKGLVFGAPAAFETMGKGVLDVFASAPKGIAGGGKAVFGGVTGVFGGGQKKRPQNQVTPNGSVQQSRTSIGREDSGGIMTPASAPNRPSYSSSQLSISAAEPSTGPSSTTSLDLSHSTMSNFHSQANGSDQESPIRSRKITELYAQPKEAGKAATLLQQTSSLAEPQDFQLPPPPSEMPDNYGLNLRQVATSSAPSPNANPKTFDMNSMEPILTAPVDSSPTTAPPPSTNNNNSTEPPPPLRPHASTATSSPLTAEETTLTLELFFLLINQLYTLSPSVWSLRRTLLTAAKNYLLRSGNPQLEALRVLIQDTVIGANTSPGAIAGYIDGMRKSALPTSEELAEWEEKEKAKAKTKKSPENAPNEEIEEQELLRKKARKLLVERGMPGALTGVMGSAATSEALGRLFDCLQVEEVARGLVFAVGVQFLRAVVM